MITGGHKPQDLFYELTESLIRLKPMIQSLFSTEVGFSKAYQRSKGLQAIFERPKPRLAVQLGNNLTEVYEAADQSDRLPSKVIETNLSVTKCQSDNAVKNCTICFDDLGRDAVSLSGCNHQACAGCWR